MTAAIDLAEWLTAVTPSSPDMMTHLKLQKLAFYAYGAALGFGVEDAIGRIEFQAWRHGPVCPDIYREYSAHGSQPIARPIDRPRSFGQAEECMRDVVNVYGRMTAWQLREETHLEQPWLDRWDGTLNVEIPTEALRMHFAAKFAGQTVAFPERLFGGSSMTLDRIPLPTFASLRRMSEAATQILGAI